MTVVRLTGGKMEKLKRMIAMLPVLVAMIWLLYDEIVTFTVYDFILTLMLGAVMVLVFQLLIYAWTGTDFIRHLLGKK